MPETTFTVRRLTVAVPSVRLFQRAYAAAVPDVPLGKVQALKDRAVPWPEMLDLINDSAPHGFLIYDRTDLHPVMELAGDHADCIAYLMGNHTIAEQMFRHDPRSMLHAPLRTLIWDDLDSHSWFTIDQPSTQFNSFDHPEIAQIGVARCRARATAGFARRRGPYDPAAESSQPRARAQQLTPAEQSYTARTPITGGASAMTAVHRITDDVAQARSGGHCAQDRTA